MVFSMSLTFPNKRSATAGRFGPPREGGNRPVAAKNRRVAARHSYYTNSVTLFRRPVYRLRAFPRTAPSSISASSVSFSWPREDDVFPISHAPGRGPTQRFYVMPAFLSRSSRNLTRALKSSISLFFDISAAGRQVHAECPYITQPQQPGM